MVERKIDRILTIVVIVVAIFGLVIIYQILRVLLGGSWSAESIISGLTMFNVSAVFTLVILVATLMSDHKHLSRRFNSLAQDFKEHTKTFNDLTQNFKILTKDFSALTNNFKRQRRRR